MTSISKPYTFSANTTISSSQMNANFDTIYNDYNGAIAAANLATSSVVTAKIADLAVTTAKINDLAVTAAKINSEAVTTAKLADDAVTPAKLAPTNTADANGWTTKDFGTFKLYHKDFTGASVSGLASLANVNLFSTQNLPVSIDEGEVRGWVRGGDDGTAGSRYLWYMDLDFTGAATTVNIGVRNVTGSSLTESNLECTVYLIDE